jgi:nitrate reductase gamma subunit
MKTSYIFGIALLLIVLVFGLAAFASFDHPKDARQSLSAAALHMQITTPTAPAANVSKAGSTDGIVIMGFVLAITVILPLLFRKKRN